MQQTAMRFLQIFLFCTAVWLVRTELTSSSLKDATTVYKEDIGFKKIELYNYTIKENGHSREKRVTPPLIRRTLLNVLTFNIQNYFTLGIRHARDPAIVNVRTACDSKTKNPGVS